MCFFPGLPGGSTGEGPATWLGLFVVTGFAALVTAFLVWLLFDAVGRM